MDDAYIVAARRTPIGRLGGAFAGTGSIDLGAVAVRAVLADIGLDTAAISEVFVGQVLTAGLGQNPARQTAMRADLPVSIPATTVNCVCGSGLKAIDLAARAICSGAGDVLIAAGQEENMSRAPHAMAGLPPGHRDGRRRGPRYHDPLMASGTLSPTCTWELRPNTWPERLGSPGSSRTSLLCTRSVRPPWPWLSSALGAKSRR